MAGGVFHVVGGIVDVVVQPAARRKRPSADSPPR
jgi:hypothetical protein